MKDDFKYFELGAKIKNCGKEPSIDDCDTIETVSEETLFDFTYCKPSIDQSEINDWLTFKGLKEKSVLHIGVGNSSIAKLFPPETNIVGVTVSNNEYLAAQNLKQQNYNVFYVNKYAEEFKLLMQPYKFDLIIDNNLASFACCEYHFSRYMNILKSALNKNGFIITHWLGMQWILSDAGIPSDEAWRLDTSSLETITKNLMMYSCRRDSIFTLHLQSSFDLF